MCMNLNNGDMLYGRHHIIKFMAPSMHCSIKHVTIVEIHTLILDVLCLMFQKIYLYINDCPKYSAMYRKYFNSEYLLCVKKVIVINNK